MTTTAAATFCATLVDEWVRAGVRLACIAPGSRSTPMALALTADPRVTCEVFLDERSAAFAALGHGIATGLPAVALCTSGTAATHFHAAVVEADLSSVPLIACTADRPPELWDIGAPQTIDQTRLYGPAVRWFAQPGVPDAALAGTWRPLAARVVAEARGWGGRPGPVQLNLSFRDPLVGEAGELPPGRDGGRPWYEAGQPNTQAGGPGPDAAAELAELVAPGGRAARPGMIVAGLGSPPAPVVDALARRLGWPVLADHRSGCRAGDHAVAHFDALLRCPAVVARAEPEVVLRLGETLASKVLSQWLAATPARVLALVGGGRWVDPELVAATVIADPGAGAALLDALPADLAPAATAAAWLDADARAAAAVEATLAAEPGVTEIGVARAVLAGIPAGGALVVSSSMPVRDLEWYGANRNDITVVANRGANGIDGVLSTAIGVALTGRPTTVLVGDVAFLHDATALVGLRHRPISLDVVVVNNDGGGIFSFLPQATALPTDRFEQLFGTPHGTDLGALVRAHGLEVHPWPPTPRPADANGVRVHLVSTDRATNAAVHARVNAAVATAVSC